MAFEFLINSVISAFFLLYSLALGAAVLGCLPTFKLNNDSTNNNYLKSFFYLSMGISIQILILMLLGFAGCLNKTFVGLLAAGLFPIALHSAKTCFTVFTKASLSSITLVCVLFLLTLAFSWHPPGYWDDTSFHLPLARFYLEQEAIVLHEYLRFPLFPQNMNMLMVLGLMFGDTLTAQIFATLPWFVIGIGLMGACKWLNGSSVIGFLVALVLVKYIGAFKVGFGYAYVDAGLALFCWSSLLSLVLWYEQYREKIPGSVAWILIAGFLGGAAAGTKLFGGVFAFILLVYILFLTRTFRIGLLFGALVLSSGAWWYLRSYLISGDPFHPVAAKYFGYYLWNEQDLLSQVSEQSLQTVDKNPLYFFSALKNAGVQLWILVFIGFCVKNLPPAIRLMQFIFITYFSFWFFVTQVERYLAPVIVLATFLACYTLYVLLLFLYQKLNLQRSNRNFSFLLNIVVALWGVSIAAKEIGRSIVKWDDRLEGNQGYELFTKASTLRPEYGDRLVQVGFENAAYFFSGIAIGDWFGVARYSRMTTCDNTGCQLLGEVEMKELLLGFNSKMLAVSFERYPLFRPEDYSTQFNLVLQNSQGALLVTK